MSDIYFYEAFEEECEMLRSNLPSAIRAGFTRKTIQETDDQRPPSPIISIRTQSIIPPAWAKSLRAVLSRSAGYDHIAAYRKQAEQDLAYGYLPEYCARSVAEHALMLWLALARKLPRQISQFSCFERDGITGFECCNAVLVVVGVGHIGRQVVEIGRGLGMRVYGVDIVHRHDDVEYLEIEEALPKADIIVCAMNLTDLNIGYFNYDRLCKSKPGVFFVNIARGEISPPPDLLRLLNEDQLGGVGLDVYDAEQELAVQLRSGQDPTGPKSEAVLALSRHAHAILTPHNAFNTRQAVQRKAEQSIRQIMHFLEHDSFCWPVPF